MISQERAREIMKKAQELAEYGPWSDQLDKVILPDEHKQIMLHWSALPGDSTYLDAFNNFLYGRIGEAG